MTSKGPGGKARKTKMISKIGSSDWPIFFESLQEGQSTLFIAHPSIILTRLCLASMQCMQFQWCEINCEFHVSSLPKSEESHAWGSGDGGVVEEEGKCATWAPATDPRGIPPADIFEHGQDQSCDSRVEGGREETQRLWVRMSGTLPFPIHVLDVYSCRCIMIHHDSMSQIDVRLFLLRRSREASVSLASFT